MFEHNYRKPKVIAEIGCNHMGQMALAKELIQQAHGCGADRAKFQKRNNRELLTPEQYDAPHPNPHNSYGSSYGQHREFLEFDVHQHQELKTYCESLGIDYASSVWDVTSARDIIGLSPDMIKVPSACNNNLELLAVLRDEYEGEIHVSLGMTHRQEENAIVELFEKHSQAQDRLVLYACTSAYPVAFSEVCLLEIQRLHKQYQSRVKSIGFSGHHLGIAVDIAAYALGAQWIERHFTSDRTLKGTDHAASLEPSGLSKLVRDLEATHCAMQYKANEIIEPEQEQRKKLKYRVTDNDTVEA